MSGLAFLGVAALLVSCSTDGADSNDGGTDSPAGGVTLIVNATSTPGTINTFPPPSGTYHQELNVTLSNSGVSKAISASFQYFTLQTDQSLVLQFSTLSDAVDTSCSMSISVANGGSFTCNLVFEVPTGQKPVTLYYDDTVGDTASAAMPPPPTPVTCDSDTNTNQTCQLCLYNVHRGAEFNNACNAQITAADSACASTDDQACYSTTCRPGYSPTCACMSGCASAQCAAAYKTMIDCSYAWCEANPESKGSPPSCP